MNEKEKSSVRKSKSMFERVKKTLRPRSRETSKMKKNGSKASERTKSDAPSKPIKSRSSMAKRKIRNKSHRTQGKSISKENNNSRSSTSREMDPRSQLEMLVRSLDLEEDDHLQPSPNFMNEIRKEELKEAEEKNEKKEEKKEDKKMEKKEKDDKKEEKKEDKKHEKKERKKDMSREDLQTRTSADEKSEIQKHPKAKPRSWLGMEAALSFVHKHNDIHKLRDEYIFLESLACNKTTQAFDANKARNREGSPKIYDENRVKLNRPGHDDVNYINASFITLKSFNHKVIVGQLPQLENESFVEDFWHMIYQEQITLVYLMAPDQALKSAHSALFKEEFGAYQYVGKMFVNNRRAETAGDPKEYTIEVLPEGNSDSVMCQVNHYSTWEHLQQPPKTRPIIKMIHQFLTEKQVQNANVCVVSVFGCGRACSFIGALYAINQLNNGIEPNISEIMRDIKQQRPNATESFSQYTGIYAVVLDYIARKRGSKRDPINKDINRFIDELTDMSPANSPAKEKPLH